MPTAVMLATLTERRDFGEDWLLERKFDGERCVARKEGDAVRLESRTGRDFTGTYPEVRAALAAQRLDHLLLDGEVVSFDGQQTSFSRLQQRLGVTKPSPALVEAFPVVYCVFDLLEAAGEDLTARPLVERRARLERAIMPTEGLQISEAWQDESERRYAEACRAGWEGLIAKRADAPYADGRSRDWLKLKCVLAQEFVIGGYTDPTGSRTDFGALLVGYFEGVGSGMQGRSGLATASGGSSSSVPGCANWRSPRRRSPMRGRSPVAPTGRAPSSSRRSGSPSGRRKEGSGNRASSACATTSTRRTSSGSKPAERRPLGPVERR